MEFPGWIRSLVGMVGGAPLPEGDKHGCWALQRALEGLADELENGSADALADAKRAILETYEAGEGREKMRAAFEGDDGFEKFVPKLVAQLRQMAHKADLAGGSLEAAEARIYSIMGILALELAFSWKWGPAAPLAEGIAIAAARFGLMRMAMQLLLRMGMEGFAPFLARLGVRVVAHGAFGATIAGGLDFGIQQWEIHHGHQDEFDHTAFQTMLAAGFGGGALASGGLFSATKLLGPAFAASPVKMALLGMGLGGTLGGAGGWLGGGLYGQYVAHNPDAWHFDWRMISAGVLGAGFSMGGRHAISAIVGEPRGGPFMRMASQLGIDVNDMTPLAKPGGSHANQSFGIREGWAEAGKVGRSLDQEGSNTGYVGKRRLTEPSDGNTVQPKLSEAPEPSTTARIAGTPGTIDTTPDATAGPGSPSGRVQHTGELPHQGDVPVACAATRDTAGAPSVRPG
ncbi:MAG: hypothetical protein HOQ24_17215, partial [Mycobacteriaceae bacterium]|nr:hypothetical protein [Mycobacteriaceae bacterium]